MLEKWVSRFGLLGKPIDKEVRNKKNSER